IVVISKGQTAPGSHSGRRISRPLSSGGETAPMGWMRPVTATALLANELIACSLILSEEELRISPPQAFQPARLFPSCLVAVLFSAPARSRPRTAKPAEQQVQMRAKPDRARGGCRSRRA